MPCSTAEARDEINTLFWDAWRTEAPKACDGEVPDVLWEAGERVGEPRSDKPWARVSIHHNDSLQRTFGGEGDRRFERLGLVSVQVFVPTSIEQGTELLEALADIGRNAYEGKATSCGAWFRNVRFQEFQPSEPWLRMDVVAEFTYDELK